MKLHIISILLLIFELACTKKKEDNPIDSTDNGATFTNKFNLSFSSESSGIPYTSEAIRVFVAGENNIYAQTQKHIFKSVNGTSWDSISSALLPSLPSGDVYYAASYHQGSLYLGTPSGLFRFQTDSLTLQNLNFNDYAIQSIGVQNHSNVVVGSYANFIFGKEGLAATTNGGANWLKINDADNRDLNYVTDIHVQGQEIVAGTSGGVRVSDFNSPANWQLYVPDTGEAKIVSALHYDNGTYYVGTWGGLFSTTNFTSWVQHHDERVIDIARLGNYLFAIKFGAMLVSEDNGQTWTEYTQENGYSLSTAGTMTTFNQTLYIALANQGYATITIN